MYHFYKITDSLCLIFFSDKKSDPGSEQDFELNEDSLSENDDISYWGSEFDDVSIQVRVLRLFTKTL